MHTHGGMSRASMKEIDGIEERLASAVDIVF